MDEAFVIMQIGKEGTPERKRANEVFEFILEPVLNEFNIRPYRSDRDPTPGPISPQMLGKLIESRLVVADLTGRNPNVFYELGIVHSFARPLVSVADSIESLPFDTKDERIIVIGEYNGKLAADQAKEGIRKLRDALNIVLADGYQPLSPIANVAAIRSLADLAPENPVAAQIAALKYIADEMYRDVGSILAALKGTPYWLRSTHSASRTGVEVAFIDDDKIAVRNGTGTILTFNSQEWEAFLGGIRNGEFDLP